MKNRINIGTASIILIFIILCLAVFSLLSLSDGNSALVLARRRADSVTAYYRPMPWARSSSRLPSRLLTVTKAWRRPFLMQLH